MDRTDKLREYLYGELSGESRDALEEKIFSDEEFAAKLDDYENNLIDAFVRGEMTGEQTHRFREKYITSVSRLARVDLARSLNRASPVGPAILEVGAAEPHTLGWWERMWEWIWEFFGNRGLVYSGGAVAVVLIITSGLWFLSTIAGDEVVYDEPKTSVNAIVPPIPDAAAKDLPPEQLGEHATAGSDTKRNVNTDDRRLSANHAVRESSRTFAFTLFPPIRSSGRPVLEIPKGTEFIRITIVHNNKKPYRKYKAELKDNNGKLLLMREMNVVPYNLERPVSILIRADRFRVGSYEVTLVGSTRPEPDEEIGFYGFSVKRK